MMIFTLFFSFTCLSFFSHCSIAVDILSPNQFLIDNGTTLVSLSQKFELGFFSPSDSQNRYVGIWFKNVPLQTPVWVANKNYPLTNTSGVLTITTHGNIVIINNQTRTTIWSSNSSQPTTLNPILKLLDNGNLVIMEGGGDDPKSYLWQSFDWPCDTLIPGMKMGWNLESGKEWFLTSWKSAQDPSSGAYTYKFDHRRVPQVLLRQGNYTVEYRSGYWDGHHFGGGPALRRNAVYNPVFSFDSTNGYYYFETEDDTLISRFVIGELGLLQQFRWGEMRNEWITIVTLQGDKCDSYGLCGPYGICDPRGKPVCQCPAGFTPRFPHDWEKLDWSGGCVRQKPLNCSSQHRFRKFSGMKLPDASESLVNKTLMTLMECKAACSKNCSCMAYAENEVGGCLVWSGDLIDIRKYSEGGKHLYIRMDASELGFERNVKLLATVASASALAIMGILLFICCWYSYHIRISKRRASVSQRDHIMLCKQKSSKHEDIELPIFGKALISLATNKFSTINKIGEGSFGSVYKGQLLTGEEIAVKRLSRHSWQGLNEFKNEVVLYSKLQHRNLVRLLGCCIDGEERMLVYEYMPNKSLDSIIFDQTRAKSLEWGKRYDIIVGVARGLLYLHRDSRMRIVHRDLKASNILLDSQMNPKIADFGLARTFGCDQLQENTVRIMGTYGYMSPEYAIDGIFSLKSDVFSYGVLVLEIVSGKKNRGFCHPDHDLNLLGHAWKLWNKGQAMKLVDDDNMGSSFSVSEALRCIHVSLLCVQKHPEDRPTMSTALLMLDSENPNLPQPKQPGFFSERNFTDSGSLSAEEIAFTSNEMTITVLSGR